MQVDVGGGDHPHIDLLGARRADAFDLSRLQHAQQLGLLAIGNVADLVEKDGAAVRQLEASDAVGLGVGECAFHMAEELAFEDALRQRAGVHRDQRTLRACGKRMDGLRDNFFAGAMLAE